MMLQLHRHIPVHAPTHRPQPTHEAIFIWYCRHAEEGQIIGRISFRVDNGEDTRRLSLLKCRLQLAIGHELKHNTIPLAIHREAVRMSDLERMRRKWRRVVAAFEHDRAAILAGADGMFIQERMNELQALLEQARQKVESTYGHRITDLDDVALLKRTLQLSAMGLINTKDYNYVP